MLGARAELRLLRMYCAAATISPGPPPAVQVGKAFEADGARCSEASAHVVFVTADQQALEFGKPSAASELPRPEEWDAAARRAVRVYVR